LAHVEDERHGDLEERLEVVCRELLQRRTQLDVGVVDQCRWGLPWLRRRL
jgi:hypothetical protein